MEIGAGVTSVKPGDHVIPLYIPECGKCKFCQSGRTNLCGAIRLTQGKGVMPDGTSRFSLKAENHPTLHGHVHILGIYRAARNRRRQNQSGGATRQSLSAWLRYHHGNRRGSQHGQSSTRLNGGGVRLRRHRSQRCSRPGHGQSRTNHRRRYESPQIRDGEKSGRDGLRRAARERPPVQKCSSR